MAKYKLESIMYGDKYNIESDVFVKVVELVEQGIQPKEIRERLQMLYARETIKTIIRMISEGDSISDIPEFGSLSSYEEETK